MTDGAIDNEYDDAEQSYEQQLCETLGDIRQEPMAGGVAIDVVTRQVVFVRERVADTLEEYYEEEGFDLYTYKMHPWLPGIDIANAVYSCVYADGNPQNAHKPGKTYDFPSARLMHLPVELAWRDAEVGDL